MNNYNMKWFDELSLIEKIRTYGELMYDLGVLPFDSKTDALVSERNSMLSSIEKDILSLQKEVV